MRGKRFTHGITFFVTAEMYQAIKKDTDELQISTSDLMRRLTEDYLYRDSFLFQTQFRGKGD